jgi:hypothetical protein
MTAKIQVRRDTNSAFAAVTLAAGEFGLATDLRQLKIGDGSTVWTSLPWLGGTLPVFTSPNTDANDASNRVQGVYRFSNASAITNGPSAPINIVANDGGATMLVIVADSHVVQQLWTDGDGSTQVPKSYSRVYDHGSTAWRPWAAQSSWGISATEGVNLSARSLTVEDGSVGTPSITNRDDTNTGLYFPSDDQVGISVNGTNAILAASDGVKVNTSPVIANALKEHVMRLNDLSQMGAISTLIAQSNTSVTDVGGQIQWTVANIGVASSVTLTPNSYTWYGWAIAFDTDGELYSFTSIPYSSASSGAWTLPGVGTVVGTILLVAFRKFP